MQPGQFLTVPITIKTEVSIMNKHSLIATINNSITLNKRHYWAFIKDLHSSSWYSCYEKLVFNVKESSLNKSYTVFFTEKFNFFPGATNT